MEEKLFENETLLDRKLLIEAIKAQYNDMTMVRIAKILAWIIVGLGTIVVVLCLILQYFSSLPQFLWPLILLLVLVLICSCVLAFNGYLLIIPSLYKTLHTQNPDLHYTYVFYMDSFEEITSSSRRMLKYKNITRILETKNTIILFIVALRIIIDKRSFQNATTNGEISFLKGICSNATYTFCK